MIDINFIPRNRYRWAYNLYLFFFNFSSYGFYNLRNQKYTYIEQHFGDNIIHVNLLCKLVENNPNLYVSHFCNSNYIDPIRKYIQSIPNIQVYPLGKRPWFATNAWKNYMNQWETNANRYNFVVYYIGFFKRLCRNLSLTSPILVAEDFIFDGSKLVSHDICESGYDWLIVNSTPLSGQFFCKKSELDDLVRFLSLRSKVITTEKVDGIPCTRDWSLDLFQIGQLSTRCKNLLMISTGPSWLPLNSYTIKSCENIILLINGENVYLSERVVNIGSIDEFYQHYTHTLPI